MSVKSLMGCLALSLLFACSGSSDKGDTDAGPVDAGHSDAGELDAGPVDAGPSDAGPNDAGCPYAYCEDFDGYDAGLLANGQQLGPWKASLSGINTTMRVAPTGGFAGSQALRVTIVWVADGGSVRATLNQHIPDGGALLPGHTLFGRAEILYSAAEDAGLPLNVHSWFFNAAGKTADGGNTSMNLGGGGAKLQLNYQYPPAAAYPDGGKPRTEDSVQGGMLTTGGWHCVQWEYNGTQPAPGNIANVWLDGTSVLAVYANDAGRPSKDWMLSPAYSSFDFGFTHYQTLPNGVDVYLDNFALDDAMIPCP